MALALLVGVYLLPGLAAHDPWKFQDAIAIGIAHGMASGGDLLVSNLAGRRWMYDPPLYHWVAAAFGKSLQFVLGFHAAARLASAAFLAAAFYFLYLAGRDLSKGEQAPVNAAAALLLLLGSVGLVVHSHEALPELAALSAVCGALATLPHAKRLPLKTGALFGMALGLAFLAAGWIAPVSVLLAVTIAHLACAEWRNRPGAVFLAAALATGLAIAGAWALALALRSPEALREWGALAAQRQGGTYQNLRNLLSTLAWFAWPAWPIALWSAWSLRRRWREPMLFAPALASLVLVGLLSWWGPAQQENLIPMLAPLALFAAQGISTLRRGAEAALDWFGVACALMGTAVLWAYYVPLINGAPAPMARSLARTAPGFMSQFDLFAVLVAAALALGWLYLFFFTLRSPGRCALRWAAGIVLLWGTFSLLWMPWADHQKSYRSVALQLRSRMPVGADCLAQKALGVSQAAALDYHAGIRARPWDILRPYSCPLLLVQGSPKHELDTPGPRWIKLADVGRPGDKLERYRLYRLK